WCQLVGCSPYLDVGSSYRDPVRVGPAVRARTQAGGRVPRPARRGVEAELHAHESAPRPLADDPVLVTHWLHIPTKNGSCRWKTSRDVSAGQPPFSATTDRG